jgi:hypothetical protein
MDEIGIKAACSKRSFGDGPVLTCSVHAAFAAFRDTAPKKSGAEDHADGTEHI